MGVGGWGLTYKQTNNYTNKPKQKTLARAVVAAFFLLQTTTTTTTMRTIPVVFLFCSLPLTLTLTVAAVSHPQQLQPHSSHSQHPRYQYHHDQSIGRRRGSSSTSRPVVILGQEQSTLVVGISKRRRTTTRTTMSISTTTTTARQAAAGWPLDDNNDKTAWTNLRGGSQGGKEEERDDCQSLLSSKEQSSSLSSSSPSSPSLSRNNREQIQFRLQVITIVSGFITMAIYYRHYWMPILLDKKQLQQTAVQTLEKLRPPPNAPWWIFVQSHALYALGMTFWELVGLSTIPVETAAGMVFGWPWGAVASAMGKLCGASLAFWIGQGQLRTYVQTKVQHNPLCQLLAESHAHPQQQQQQTQQPPNRQQQEQQQRWHHPLQTALLMKFSCFPETIKNFGTAALLPTVHYGWFLLATAFHGIMFTMLWTWLGVETSQSLGASTTTTATTAATKAAGASTSAVTATTSRGLQLALTFTLFLGLVVSPASMAWWIRDLRRQAAVNAEMNRQQQQQQKQWWSGWQRRIGQGRHRPNSKQLL